MQADEEYGNEVWDKHFGALYLQLEHQKYCSIQWIHQPFFNCT